MVAGAVSIGSDAAICVSALVVAVVAIVGLRTWRKELTGKARFEVARNIMFLAFKFGTEFEAARNIATFSPEYAGRSKQDDETTAISRVLDEWYARTNRLRPLQEDLVKLQEASWEAEILLVDDASRQVSEAVQAYRHNYAELSEAVYSYFEARHEGAGSGIPYKDQGGLTDLRKTIYSVGGDDLSKQIEEATTRIRQALRAYVR